MSENNFMTKRKYRELIKDIRRYNTVQIPRIGNYFHLGKKHVLVGWREYDIPILDTMVNLSSNQKIHIFVSEWDDIEDGSLANTMIKLLESSVNVKVIFHTHYTRNVLLDDLEEQMQNMITKNDTLIAISKRIMYINDHKDTIVFKRSHESYEYGFNYEVSNDRLIKSHTRKPVYGLHVHYSGNSILCDISVFRNQMMEIDTGAAIQNDAQRANPGKHKKEIIANFKANTPLGMLKTFRDENDIWNYIWHRGPWAVSKPVETIHISNPINISTDMTDEEIGMLADNAVTNAIKDAYKKQ